MKNGWKSPNIYFKVVVWTSRWLPRHGGCFFGLRKPGEESQVKVPGSIFDIQKLQKKSRVNDRIDSPKLQKPFLESVFIPG